MSLAKLSSLVSSDTGKRALYSIGVVTAALIGYGINYFKTFVPGHKTDFLERSLLEYAVKHSTAGDAESVLKAIDDFSFKSSRLVINVGPVKGAIVDKYIAERKPKLILELGGYCGYSAIRFGSQQLRALTTSTPSSALGDGSGTKGLYVSVEIDPLFASISSKLIERAALSDSVRVLIGNLASERENIRELIIKLFGFGPLGADSGKGVGPKFDMIFIDHWKKCYLPDFLLLEEYGFIGPNTVIIADNVIFPGAPDYVSLLMNEKSGDYESKLIESTLEYSTVKDGLLVSVRK